METDDIMHVNLMEHTVCPICRNDLQWSIKDIYKDRIIDGYAECVKCQEIYPIHDEVIFFLPTKFQNAKIWERGERVAIRKSEIEMGSLNEKIKKPSELLDMIRIRNMQGDVRNEDLYRLYMEMIGMPKTLSKLLSLAQKCADRIEDKDYVLDFASGKCLLADTLRKTINCHIIISDINPIIIKQAKQEFERQG